jgi:integrase
VRGQAVEKGAPIVAISKLLGHSSLQITMRYAHPDESLRETVEKVGNFNKKYSNEKADLS